MIAPRAGPHRRWPDLSVDASYRRGLVANSLDIGPALAVARSSRQCLAFAVVAYPKTAGYTHTDALPPLPLCLSYSLTPVMP